MNEVLICPFRYNYFTILYLKKHSDHEMRANKENYFGIKKKVHKLSFHYCYLSMCIVENKYIKCICSTAILDESLVKVVKRLFFLLLHQATIKGH